MTLCGKITAGEWGMSRYLKEGILGISSFFVFRNNQVRYS